MTKVFYCCLLFFAACLALHSQACTGNLGENIFTDGDFGSGSANVLSPDPQIAPGYTYQFSPPPDDGFYTITNNISSWGSFANTWDDIRDNSNDPNGYMMIVNASSDPGIFYQQQVDGLCENTLYYLSIDVYNLINAINPNISFLLDGVQTFTSGSVPYNKQWNTYGFTFTTNPGQTSLTLAIQNNAPGGQGNDLALDNISFRPCGPEALILPQEVADICADGNPIDLEATIIGNQYDNPQIQWQESFDGGINWSNITGANNFIYTHSNLTSGFYYYRYLLANDPSNLLNSKCRVVSNIKVVNVLPEFYNVADTICQGLTYSLGAELYTDSGIYQDSLLSSIGCDSIVILDLEVVPDPTIVPTFEQVDPSCNDFEDGELNITNISNGAEPYLISINGEPSINGELNNLAPGTYTYLITDRHGCSTEMTLVLNNPDLYTIEIGDDQAVTLGESIVITPLVSQSTLSIDWSTGEFSECDPECADIELLPLSSQVIYATATSIDGCTTSDSIRLSVDIVRSVYIPNIFSPNQDGVNDKFTIYASVPNVSIIEKLSIYDRWGNLIYDQAQLLPNDTSKGWDGKSGSTVYPPGVYTYKADVRFLDNQLITYTGDISLVQ